MSSISILGDTSGSVLIQAPAVAGSTTVTLPSSSMTIYTPECDQWVITAAISLSSGANYITTNWARNALSWYSKVGTGMSQSSGVFTFPSTGTYRVEYYAYVTTSGVQRYVGSEIFVATDGSTFSLASEAYQTQSASGSTYYLTPVSTIILNVTNTTNVKVKFRTDMDSTGTLQGSTTGVAANAIFTKVGP